MEYLNYLLEFPVAIPFTGLFICLLLLFLSIIGLAFDADVDFPEGVDNLYITCGLSKVPLVVGLTFTFLPMTFLMSLFNEFILKIPLLQQFFNSGTLGSISYHSLIFISLIIIFVISLFIAGILTKPIRKIINIEEIPIEYIGQKGIVISSTVDNNSGEIKVIINNQECLLSAASEENLAYGQQIEIVSIEDKKFIVKKVN